MVANIYSIYHLYILYVANLGIFLYATSHLLGEPETTIELSYKKSRESEVGNRKSIRNQLVSYSYLKENQGFYNLIERLVPKNHGSNFPQIQSSFQWMIKGPGKRKVFRFPFTFFRGWARIPRDWKKMPPVVLNDVLFWLKWWLNEHEMATGHVWFQSSPMFVGGIFLCVLLMTILRPTPNGTNPWPIAAGDFSLKQWHGFEAGMAWSSHARPTDLGLP